MKIQSLYIDNFLGIQRVDVATPAPVQLFAGRNGAGKSSVRDAIALVLTADLGRVGLKKEAGQLVREGAEAANIAITMDGRELSLGITAAGKVTDRAGGHESPALACVLNAQRFASMPLKERQAFLFGVMGLKTDGPAIVERLLAKGHTQARIDRIASLLRSGFEAAHADAKAKATENKGAWRSVTGETYGSEKAKTWRAEVPKFDAAAAKTLATEVQHIDTALASWNQTVGKLQAEETRRVQLRAKLPALEEQAGRVERIERKLTTDEEQLAIWDAELAKVKAAAGTAPRVGLVHELGGALDECLRMVIPFGSMDERQKGALRAANAALAAYETEHGKVGTTTSNPEALSKLPEVQRSRDMLANAVANGGRDLAAAKRAREDADAITAELAETFDTAGLADAREQIETLTAERKAKHQQLDALSAVKAKVESAKQKTEEAAQFAQAVVAWDAIADDLAPNGIPGELLAEALDPLNRRLAHGAGLAEWPVPFIGNDMAISVDGFKPGDNLRPYALLSESEKWRTDALLAEAITHLSGTRLLVLDRFDVLDLKGRDDLIAWLDALAEDREIDTALIFGTLKALPASLPPTIDAHWIDRGHIHQLKAAA